VGATLIVLGLSVVYGLVRHGSRFRMRSRWMVLASMAARGRSYLRSRKSRVVIIEHSHEHSHDQCRDRTQYHQKIEIAQFSLTGDHDVGRIADQRRNPTNIRCERLGHKECNGIEFQSLGNRQGDGRHEQHGCDVIEHGREPSRR